MAMGYREIWREGQACEDQALVLDIESVYIR